MLLKFYPVDVVSCVMFSSPTFSRLHSVFSGHFIYCPGFCTGVNSTACISLGAQTIE